MDKWIPSPIKYSVQSLVKILPNNSLVNELVNTDSGEWKRELIFQIFQKEKTKKIYNFSLSRYGVEDKIIWRPTLNGDFTVILANTQNVKEFKG